MSLEPTLEDSCGRYVDLGWSLIPLPYGSKKPTTEWHGAQERPATEDEIASWGRCNIGLATGKVSGVVVVDCDNVEAEKAAQELGLVSPVAVRTRRGIHYYFAHPGGQVPNRAGRANGRAQDWPSIAGLDRRGDGGFVVLPPSIIVDENGEIVGVYRWEVQPGWDLDDLPPYPLRTHVPKEEPREAVLPSLKGVKTPSGMSAWDRTSAQVEASGRFKEGDGRNVALTEFVGELIASGVLTGEEMSTRVNAFQERFFDEPLPVHEVETICRSILESEKRHHPDRLATNGAKATREVPPWAKKGYLTLAEMATYPVSSSAPLIDPLLENVASVAQVYGFSGGGKSWLLKHILTNAALGMPFGPFVPARRVRTLYLDFENGIGTLAERAQGLIHSHGDPGDNFMLHAAAVYDNDIILNVPSGPRRLEDLVKATGPEVVVFDTVRSAWPGLEENKAEAWAPVNSVAASLRAAGCHVILVHHGNKPSEQNPNGSEAGNTAQLILLDTQMSVQALYTDPEVARLRRGSHWPEDKLAEYEGSLFNPQDRIAFGWKVGWGKDRNSNVSRKTYWLGMAEDVKSGRHYSLCDLSPRQEAGHMFFNEGRDIIQVAREVGYSLPHVRRWLLHECERMNIDPSEAGLS